MTDENGAPPQKTVAELLAQHGQQVEGSRRRRRRAAEDDEAPEPQPESGRRAAGVSDTAPQAIIDRVTSDGGTPPPPSRSAGGRRRSDGPAAPAPRAVPQESGPMQRPPAPPAPPAGPQGPGGLAGPGPGPAGPAGPGGPGGPAGPPTRSVRPVNGQQDSGYVRQPPPESGQFARPPAPPQESGQFVRPQETGYTRPPAPPQESGQFARPQESAQLPVPPSPSAESSQFVRPPAPPQESGQMPVPPRGRPTRQQPVPPPGAEETRNQVPPVRRHPGPPPAPGGPLASRLDGLDGTPDADVPEPPMASGAFPTGAPQRPRRAPARRPAPQQDPHTEQFDAVAGVAPEAPEVAPGPGPGGPRPGGPPAQPPGLAGWRKRREQEQLEDTEIGVMPVVPGESADAYADEDYAADDYAEPYAPEGDYDGGPPTMAAPADFDAGPPTAGYPAPMPFAPGGGPVDDDLSEYEREFAQPGSPDFDGDDYGYDQHGDYEDDYDDVAPEEPAAAPVAAEPALEGSPGKQWLTLAGQLALGVVGGAGVWLGFNWLWVNLAPAALVGALLVIVALVWIVRKIRRAEDLQTTLLAILVGLVVTVSPAALLLVGR
ncbi:hypothetical protein K1T34_21015 [Amycolatopsis sp. DSM 110486]|nr:hypothetical protein K1T34_21015 [Amycolatopsis sp. DSM 110486]